MCGSLVTLQLYNRAQPHVSVAAGASGGTRLLRGTQVNEPLVCFSTEKAIRDMKAICLQLERNPKSRHPLSFLILFFLVSFSLPFPSCTFYLHSFYLSVFFIPWTIIQCTRDMVASCGALSWFTENIARHSPYSHNDFPCWEIQTAWRAIEAQNRDMCPRITATQVGSCTGK